MLAHLLHIKNTVALKKKHVYNTQKQSRHTKHKHRKMYTTESRDKLFGVSAKSLLAINLSY